jgi:hypothetical protein
MEIKNLIKMVFIIVLSFSIMVNVALVFLLTKTTISLEKEQETKAKSHSIMLFTNMFVKKILMANSDVDFDTRLDLETSVRSLNDEEILFQWQKFTNSSEGAEASKEAKNLLNLLTTKSSLLNN